MEMGWACCKKKKKDNRWTKKLLELLEQEKNRGRREGGEMN